MIRSPITTPGPLNVSATITAGDTYPDITIKAPLGPKFQAITGLTNNAAVDLATFVNTDQIITGPNGTFIYKDAVTADKQLQAEQYLGVV